VEDSGYDMLDCETCRLPAHRRCIGEKVPYREIRPMKGNPIRLHECQRCTYETTHENAKLKCLSCFRTGGLMTQIEEHRYVHIICAIMSDYFEIVDFNLMRFRQVLP
jgi:hypothetical protein